MNQIAKQILKRTTQNYRYLYQYSTQKLDHSQLSQQSIYNSVIFQFSTKKHKSTDVSKQKFLKRRKAILKKQSKGEYDQEQFYQQEEEIQQEEINDSSQSIDLSELMRQDINTVPPHLVIKNLYYPKTKSHIIVLGVENINPVHSSYVYDILESAKPDIILTQINPDQPYFIKTNGDFDQAWKKFVKGKFDYQFLVNPKPTYLGDITMNIDVIEHFIAGAVLGTPGEFDMRDKYIKTFSHVFQDFTYNTFLTPLIHAYNNPHYKASVVVNDLPYIKYRDYIVRNMPLEELKDIYKNQVEEYKKGNYNFDPQLYSPEYLLKPKLNYVIETMKHAAYSNKRVIQIMDRHLADLIDDEWDQVTDKLHSFNKFYTSDFENEIQKKDKLTFIEYIEKHVILDLMFEPILRKYFVINKSFPYIANDTMGYYTMNQSLFVVFEHYYRTYVKMLNLDGSEIYKKMADNQDKADMMGDLNMSYKKYNKNQNDEYDSDNDDMDYGRDIKNPLNPISMFN